jgi:manganese/zinc/iron transport system permease protein
MSLFEGANVWYVIIGTALFGISSGVLGCFAVLRKHALMGDALAHAALPGVCLAFLLSGGMKHPLLFIIGAATTGLLGSLAIQAITRWSRIKEDAAIGLILSVFFGVGIVLLTYIQHQPYGNQAGIDKFLFGQAAAMVTQDVALFGGLAVLLLLAVLMAYKEFKVIAFDPGFARASGIPVGAMDVFLLVLIVLVVTAGLQAVGVVLMAAMLITPAAAARQWTDRLGWMLCLSALFGATAGVIGTIISTTASRMPTGPWIVVAVTTIFGISIVLAPRRGILQRWLVQHKTAGRIQRENVLKTLYRLTEDRGFPAYPIATIQEYRHLTTRTCQRLLRRLKDLGWAACDTQSAMWRLTDTGRSEAARLVRRHRLWEVYLTRYLHLGKGQVHTDAEDIEHVLTPALERELEILLEHPTVDPHERPIPYPEGRPA